MGATKPVTDKTFETEILQSTRTSPEVLEDPGYRADRQHAVARPRGGLGAAAGTTGGAPSPPGARPVTT